MHNIRNDSRGVAPILLVLILLFLAIAGFAGWRVWDMSRSEPATSSNSPTPSPKSEAPEEIPAPTLERVSGAGDSYSVALPIGWVHRSCDDSNILFLAPSDDLLGKCNSDSFGVLSIGRNTGDTRAEGDPASDPTATDVSVSSVTVDSQPATKTRYTVGSTESIVPAGTRFVRYQILYEGYTYTIGSTQMPDGASYTDQLDEIVGSFRFSE